MQLCLLYCIDVLGLNFTIKDNEIFQCDSVLTQDYNYYLSVLKENSRVYVIKLNYDILIG